MLIEAFLRGLIVVWSNNEYAVNAREVGTGQELHDGLRRVASGAEEEGNPSVHRFHDGADNLRAFFVVEAWRFSRRAQYAKEVDASCQLFFHEAAERLVVDCSVGGKRGGECYAEAPKRIAEFV